jgi:hypothetical protein
MKKLLLIAVVLLHASVVHAQTPTQLEVSFYNANTSAQVVAPFLIQVSQMQCGVPVIPAPTAVVQNPNTYTVTDPTNGTLDCRYVEPAGGPLFMLQFDTQLVYVARARWINLVGPGELSTSSNPFTRPGALPAIPSSLRIVRAGS